MRLLVSCVPFDSGKSGISTYTRALVRSLQEAGHTLTLLVEPAPAVVPALDGATAVSAPRWTRRPVLSMLWHLLLLPFWIRRHAGAFDGFVIAAANRRVCAFYPLPTVATVHDLANFHVPGKYSRLRMFYLAHVLPCFAKKAQRLVAVSESTKADMVRFWHCAPQDVTVLYEGLPSAFQRSATKRPSGSSILYISRIEHPGKNHVRLIEAYGRLPRVLAEAHPLVLAGADWKDAALVHAAAARCRNSDLVRFTGFVPDGEIEALWERTGFYVFPSLYEGFGLTLAEAMARGVPCACSSNGSLGEIGGDAAVKFDPESIDSIADALEKLLSEPQSERDARISRGLERTEKFSWQRHAAGVAELVSGAGHRRRSFVPLFGIPVARLTTAETVGTILDWARQGRARREAGHPVGPPRVVATANVDFVVNAVPWRPWRRGGELLQCLRAADIVTADGMPIVALSRLVGDPLPERVAGSDMTPELCRACAAEGLRFYVLGGTDDSLREAFSRLGLSASPAIAGTDSSRVDLDGDQSETLRRIANARPDILFVALGNPKQELWIRRNLSRIDAPVAIGVGGSFNFVAGRVKRAPLWMQRCGLEWVHRIVQEPGRLWRRYAVGIVKFSWLSLWAVCGRCRERLEK